MGQQQLLLTIGAIVIFSISSLAVNQKMVRQSDAIYQQQATFFAIGLAQQIIEEAKLLAFDENTIDNSSGTYPNNFTSWNNLGGPDADDVDDLVDIYDPPITVSDPIEMTISCDVVYVTDSDFSTDAGTETFYKKLTVVVTSPYLDNSVTAEYVFGFHKNH